MQGKCDNMQLKYNIAFIILAGTKSEQVGTAYSLHLTCQTTKQYLRVYDEIHSLRTHKYLGFSTRRIVRL